MILGFDVNISKDMLNFAQNKNIKIINDKIVYNLVDEYKLFSDSINNDIRNKYPNLGNKCIMSILPEYVFLKKNPLLFGVKIIKNELKIGTIIEAIKDDKCITLGHVTSIQKNNIATNSGFADEDVCIKIESNNHVNYEFGKDFNHTFLLQTHHNMDDVYLLNEYAEIFNH